MIWASLVDDPSAHPEQFPTEQAQEKERRRLFRILEELVKWENSNDKRVLDAAKAEILKSTDGNPPPLLDPFAGGGAIPLEAQRLGLEAHAHDLNPVAVMINKAMIEIPPKFAGQPPVNPEAQRNKLTEDDWSGTRGLAEDVRYYGEWMRAKAFERIGHLYPKVKDADGVEHTVIAWLWTRTVKCPNPACGCEMPLASSFELSKKKGKEAYVQPIIEGKNIRYEVRKGKGAPEPPKMGRGAKFRCLCCGEMTTPEYIKAEATAERMGADLMGVVAEGVNERTYLSADDVQINAAAVHKPTDVPVQPLANDPRNIWCTIYGLDTFDKLFTNRQLVALTTFSELITEARIQIETDGGSAEYAQTISVYLSFLIDKMADLGNALNRWEPAAQCPRQLFARQAIPMIWAYAESNPFSDSSGSWAVLLHNLMNCFHSGLFDFDRDYSGTAIQADAQSTDNKKML